jgi:hypothetical protein
MGANISLFVHIIGSGATSDDGVPSREAATRGAKRPVATLALFHKFNMRSNSVFWA